MKSISVSGGSIATWSEGKGRPVIFLHGGPGDTHHYMKRMAAPLFDKFQCIFFDQRGTGLSEVKNREQNQFRLELMLEDLLAVKKTYTSGPAMLVGHSWGAMYGLFACMNSPDHFERAALLNMGPLDTETGIKTSENLLSVMTNDEREYWTQLRKRRNAARDTILTSKWIKSFGDQTGIGRRMKYFLVTFANLFAEINGYSMETTPEQFLLNGNGSKWWFGSTTHFH